LAERVSSKNLRNEDPSRHSLVTKRKAHRKEADHTPFRSVGSHVRMVSLEKKQNPTSRKTHGIGQAQRNGGQVDEFKKR